MFLLPIRIRSKIPPIPTVNGMMDGSLQSVENQSTEASEEGFESASPDQDGWILEQTGYTENASYIAENRDPVYDLTNDRSEEVNETLTISATSEENECSRYLAPDDEEGYYAPYREEEADGLEQDSSSHDYSRLISEEYSRLGNALEMVLEQFKSKEAEVREAEIRRDIRPILLVFSELHAEVKQIWLKVEELTRLTFCKQDYSAGLRDTLATTVVRFIISDESANDSILLNELR